MSRHPPFAMPADLIVGESLDAYHKRKAATLVQDRVNSGWFQRNHSALGTLLLKWERAPHNSEAGVQAWDAVERYLVEHLKDGA